MPQHSKQGVIPDWWELVTHLTLIVSDLRKESEQAKPLYSARQGSEIATSFRDVQVAEGLAMTVP
jgi:hypothetical protein